MLAILTHRFTKDLGESKLIPIKSQEYSDYVQPLSITVEKKKRWFWQSNVYTPTEYVINDILLDPIPTTSASFQTHTMIENYEADVKLSFNGNITANEVVDVDVGGSILHKFHAKVGKVLKDVVELPKVMQALEGKYLRKDSDFVAQLLADKRNCLCVVIEYAYTPDQIVIDCDKQDDGKGSLTPDTFKKVSDTTGIDSTLTRQLTLSANTRLAYRVLKLRIDPETYQLFAVHDLAKQPIPHVDPNAGEKEDERLLNIFIGSNVRQSVRKNIFELCHSSPAVLRQCLHIFESSAFISKEYTKKALEQMNPQQAALITIVGQKDEDTVRLSSKDHSVLLQAVVVLLESVCELQDAALLDLGLITDASIGFALYEAVSCVLDIKQGHKISDKSQAACNTCFSNDNANSFLNRFGITAASFQSNNMSDVHEDEIQSAKRALYGLFVDDSKLWHHRS